jgi:hypothetical protein
MVSEMKLKGRIVLEDDRGLNFFGEFYDGTPFSLRVDQFDIELNDEFLPSRRSVDGWLFVAQEAKQADRCYLTLPKPTIQFGKQVVVRALDLMPRRVTIADFGPQNPVH